MTIKFQYHLHVSTEILIDEEGLCAKIVKEETSLSKNYVCNVSVTEFVINSHWNVFEGRDELYCQFN